MPKFLHRSFPLAGVFALGILIAGAPLAVSREDADAANQPAELALVRVTITTRTRGVTDTVEINGKQIRDYSPILIHVFPSTGIVLDKRGNILTFLGYGWVNVQGKESSVQITSSEGQKWKVRLIGIDKHNGAAVVRLLEGQLKQTPICNGCGVKDGSIVRAPVSAGPGLPKLYEAQVVSVGTQAQPDRGEWALTVNRPFPDVGEPILDSEYRVLGFVANQDSDKAQTVVYPIADLLSSADKIIRRGGDIQVGWLGVFITDSGAATASEIKVESVSPDSPAQRSGLAAGDVITGYNSQRVNSALQFIRLVESTPIKSRVKLEILRKGKPVTLAAIVEPHKALQVPRKLAFNVPELLIPPVPKPVVGIDAVMLNSYLANELKTSEGGILVMGVKEKTPAESAGVLEGDIITAMDGKPIKDALSFSSYLQTLNWGAKLTLKVLRKGSEKTIAVQLPVRPQ
jgi:serine protease Do